MIEENVIFIGKYVNIIEYWIVKYGINTNKNK